VPPFARAHEGQVVAEYLVGERLLLSPEHFLAEVVERRPPVGHDVHRAVRGRHLGVRGGHREVGAGREPVVQGVQVTDPHVELHSRWGRVSRNRRIDARQVGPVAGAAVDGKRMARAGGVRGRYRHGRCGHRDGGLGGNCGVKVRHVADPLLEQVARRAGIGHDTHLGPLNVAAVAAAAVDGKHVRRSVRICSRDGRRRGRGRNGGVRGTRIRDNVGVSDPLVEYLGERSRVRGNLHHYARVVVSPAGAAVDGKRVRGRRRARRVLNREDRALRLRPIAIAVGKYSRPRSGADDEPVVLARVVHGLDHVGNVVVLRLVVARIGPLHGHAVGVVVVSRGERAGSPRLAGRECGVLPGDVTLIVPGQVAHPVRQAAIDRDVIAVALVPDDGKCRACDLTAAGQGQQLEQLVHPYQGVLRHAGVGAVERGVSDIVRRGVDVGLIEGRVRKPGPRVALFTELDGIPTRRPDHQAQTDQQTNGESDLGHYYGSLFQVAGRQTID